MTEEQEKMGFREWTTHYEREQEADRNKISDLTEAVSNINSNVGALTANVRTLMDNQKSMHNRMNRPTNWGVFATFAGVIFMMVGLVVSSIKDDINHIERQTSIETERNLELHMWFRDAIAKNGEEIAAHHIEVEWVKKMEDRMNRRIHNEN